MINRAGADKLDEAIDCFEENWSIESRQQIRDLLEEFALQSDLTALTELVRIDIERRYQQGAAIELDQCMAEFTELANSPDCIAQIAFEDFRARAAHGHSLSADRWKHLPGVSKQTWFRQLSTQSVVGRRPLTNHTNLGDDQLESDSVFESIGFELVTEIGRGTFSRVYLARQSELADRYVVLKVVSQPLKEPESMAMLQHTNIVPIYSFHRIGSRSAICMPYAGSLTLAEFLNRKGRDGKATESNDPGTARRGQDLISTVRNRVIGSTLREADHRQRQPPRSESKLPAADERAVLQPLEQLQQFDCSQLATWMFSRLAAALAHSHARGILHGDIKPGNVLIRNDGEPALLDFNLAQSLDALQVQHVGGTLPYMPPESYRGLMGQTIELTPASDLYSLGVMLFEFVTGRLPYPAPHSAAPIDLEPAVQLRRQPPQWNTDDESISPALRSIINRALAFDPVQRYASAEQLQQDLDCERFDRALLHASEPRRNRVRKWLRRHPRLISAASVASVLLVLLIPAVSLALLWRQESLQMASAAVFADFSQQSASALSAAMVDPLRSRSDRVRKTIAPLEEFGLLDPDGVQRLLSDHLHADELQRRREVVMRHLMHAGFAESALLRAEHRDGPVDPQRLHQLDRLIAVADHVRGERPSRAAMFLKAHRAQYAGDSDRAEVLLQQAADMPMTGDSEIYLEAVRRISERDWRGAVTLLTSLADRNTVPSALRWTMLGYSQYESGAMEDAKISYTQSIERAPTSSRLRLRRGICYLQMQQYERAESDFTKALQLEPELSSAWSSRGLVRLALERPHEAIDDFNSALEHSPQNAQTLLLRSRAYRKIGDDAAADQDFQRAMQVEVDNPSAYWARANARRLTDPEGALDDLRRANELDPDNRIVLTNMANILAVMLDRPSEAIETLGLVIELEPEFERPYADRAVLLAHAKQYDRAESDLAAALVEPNAARTWYQAACTKALIPGRANQILALRYLSMAIRSGYEARNLATDPDLESIRDMDGFKAIQRAYQLGGGLPQAQKTMPLPSPDIEQFSSSKENF